MRAKHQKDYNHGKNGMIGGNPRYRDKGWGFKKPTGGANRAVWKREIRSEYANV